MPTSLWRKHLQHQKFSRAPIVLCFAPPNLHPFGHSRLARQPALLALAALLLAGLATSGAEPASDVVSFRREIAPILAQKCLACHDAEKAKGGYRLDSYERLLKPGDSKSATVTPGQPTASKLWQLLVTKDADDRMPQKDQPLPADQIGRIERWIHQGAKFDGPDPAVALTALVPRTPHAVPPMAYTRPVAITALAFRPGGQELAAAGYHEVTIWRTNGILRRRLTNIVERVAALGFTADGAKLAVAGGSPGKLGEAKLIDAETGTTERVFILTHDLVLALAFSPDGKSIAIAGTDNAIRVFDLASGHQKMLIEQHADWILELAFSPDGSHLVSASRDKSARVFDAKTGSLENSYSGHNDLVSAVAFAPDGKLVFTAGRDRKIHGWNPADAKRTRELNGMPEETLRLLAVPSGLLSAGLDGKVRLHSFDKNGVIREFAGLTDRVCSLASDSGTQRIAAGDYAGNVVIWEARTGAMVSRFVAAPGYESARAAK